MNPNDEELDDEGKQSSKEICEEECSAPSILIDRSLLTFSANRLMGNAYAVGDKVYYAKETFESRDDYVEFQLFASKRSNMNRNVRNYFLPEEREEYCLTPTEEDEEENNDDMPIQKVNNGVIVNKQVFLTHLKWNTILEIDENLFQCYVCDAVFEKVDEHLNLKEHLLSLDRYKPFLMESCILRMVDDNYHCAVCNVVIDKEDFEHFTSEVHEENLMEAMDYGESNINEVKNRNNNKNLKACEDLDECGDILEHDSSENDYDGDVDSIWGMPSVSYAAIAKKKKTVSVPLPTFIEKDLGSRKVKVKYECWHMIIKPKRNTFYCMVCINYYRLPEMAEHCNDVNHLENLDKCKIMDNYSSHFIRKVDDKYCHCGHCNSIQLINDIEDHIDALHPQKTKEQPYTADTLADSVNNDTVKNTRDSTSKVSNNIVHSVNDKMVSDKIEINKDVVKEYLSKKMLYVICGYRISLPLTNFHVVCFRDYDFYCGLCNVVCTENIVTHVYSLYHLCLLQQTPFLLQFSYNVIRLIRGAMHCAICNLPIPPQMIYQHIQDPYHKRLLLNALTANSGIIINNNINNNDDGKSVIDKKGGNENNGSESEIEDVNRGKINNTENDDIIENSGLNKNDDVIENDASQNCEVDWESFVYIKVTDTFFKIYFASYHSIIILGNGAVYCFVCSTKVILGHVKKHIEDLKHVENIKQAKFVADYRGNLLRQKLVTFHCATCNVTVSRKDIKTHLSWPTHVKTTNTSKNHSKKTRQKDIKNGILKIEADTVKEMMYKNVKEAAYKIIAVLKRDSNVSENDKDTDNVTIDRGVHENQENKIIILEDDVLKISWDHWHGLVSTKDGRKCILCQVDVGQSEDHVVSVKHKDGIAKPLVKQMSRHIMRLVESHILHCIICNVEVANRKHIITQHIEGKKHIKAYETIKANSSQANAYTDCDEDVIKL